MAVRGSKAWPGVATSTTSRLFGSAGPDRSRWSLACRPRSEETWRTVDVVRQCVPYDERSGGPLFALGVGGHGADLRFLRPVPDRRPARHLESLFREWGLHAARGVRAAGMERSGRAGRQHRCADEHRLSCRRLAPLHCGRRQHRSHARNHACQGGTVSRLGLSSSTRKGRRGKGPYAEPRHQGDPCRRLGRGRHDHGCRRPLRGADLEAHGRAISSTQRSAVSRPM